MPLNSSKLSAANTAAVNLIEVLAQNHAIYSSLDIRTFIDTSNPMQIDLFASLYKNFYEESNENKSLEIFNELISSFPAIKKQEQEKLWNSKYQEEGNHLVVIFTQMAIIAKQSQLLETQHEFSSVAIETYKESFTSISNFVGIQENQNNSLEQVQNNLRAKLENLLDKEEILDIIVNILKENDKEEQLTIMCSYEEELAPNNFQKLLEIFQEKVGISWEEIIDDLENDLRIRTNLQHERIKIKALKKNPIYQ
jgi:hypothetical protein